MLWKEQVTEWRMAVNLTRQKHSLGSSLGGERSLAYAISRDKIPLEKTFACGQGGNGKCESSGSMDTRPWLFHASPDKALCFSAHH